MPVQKLLIKPVLILLLILVTIAVIIDQKHNSPQYVVTRFIKAVQNKDKKTVYQVTRTEMIFKELAQISEIKNITANSHADLTSLIQHSFDRQISGGKTSSLEKTENQADYYIHSIFRPLYNINLTNPQLIKYIKFESNTIYAGIAITENATATELNGDRTVSIKLTRLHRHWLVSNFYAANTLKTTYENEKKIKLITTANKINALNIAAINQVLGIIIDNLVLEPHTVNGDFPSGSINPEKKYLAVIPGNTLIEYFPNGGLVNPFNNTPYTIKNGRIIEK